MAAPAATNVPKYVIGPLVVEGDTAVVQGQSENYKPWWGDNVRFSPNDSGVFDIYSPDSLLPQVAVDNINEPDDFKEVLKVAAEGEVAEPIATCKISSVHIGVLEGHDRFVSKFGNVVHLVEVLQGKLPGDFKPVAVPRANTRHKGPQLYAFNMNQAVFCLGHIMVFTEIQPGRKLRNPQVVVYPRWWHGKQTPAAAARRRSSRSGQQSGDAQGQVRNSGGLSDVRRRLPSGGSDRGNAPTGRGTAAPTSSVEYEDEEMEDEEMEDEEMEDEEMGDREQESMGAQGEPSGGGTSGKPAGRASCRSSGRTRSKSARAASPTQDENQAESPDVDGGARRPAAGGRKKQRTALARDGGADTLTQQSLLRALITGLDAFKKAMVKEMQTTHKLLGGLGKDLAALKEATMSHTQAGQQWMAPHHLRDNFFPLLQAAFRSHPFPDDNQKTMLLHGCIARYTGFETHEAFANKWGNNQLIDLTTKGYRYLRQCQSELLAAVSSAAKATYTEEGGLAVFTETGRFSAKKVTHLTEAWNKVVAEPGFTDAKLAVPKYKHSGSNGGAFRRPAYLQSLARGYAKMTHSDLAHYSAVKVTVRELSLIETGIYLALTGQKAEGKSNVNSTAKKADLYASVYKTLLTVNTAIMKQFEAAPGGLSSLPFNLIAEHID